MKRNILCALVCALAITGCGHNGHSHHEHAHSHEGHEHCEGHDHEHEGHNHEAEEHEHEAKDYAVVTVKSEPFGQVVRTMALVQPSQEGQQDLVALVDGVVIINGTLAEGREVRKGEVLCTIKSSGMAEGNIAVRYAQAESEYKVAKGEYERLAPLAEQKIIPESELQEAKGRYESAKAQYDALKENFSQNGQSVKAESAGYISSVSVSNGQFVAAGDPIVTIASSREIRLVAEVQPRYSQYLKNIASANFHEKNTERTWTLQELGGRVVSYGKAVSQGSPLIPVTFSVSNKAGFIPGTFVETHIITRASTKALVVPNTAILEEMGNHFVYVKEAPGDYDKKQVKVGATDGLRTQILEGIEEGDEVVEKDAVIISLAQSAGAIDPHAGHVH